MKNLILLSLIILSSCGADNAALTNNEAVKAASEQSACNLSIVGQWVNSGDTSRVFSVYDKDGECAFTVSCGAQGLIFETDINTYLLLDNSTANGCSFPNSFTNYQGHQGRAKVISFNTNGIGSVANEASNIWTKNN